MVKYHANVSPRSLSTVANGDYIRNFPARWELLKWYKCWRKIPYESEIFAAFIAEQRTEDYRHYPCPLDGTHWHIGRGGNRADPRQLTQRAKRTYRKSVRDEIWAAHEERQKHVGNDQQTEGASVA